MADERRHRATPSQPARSIVALARQRRGPRYEPYVDMAADRRFELGCGPSKLHPDAVGVDALKYDGVDIVGSIPEVLNDISEASADVVFSRHFLEHVDDLGEVLRACARVLKPGARLIAIVPHFSNPYFYSDPTHRTAFGLYTMSYFAVDAIHRRRVPSYVLDDGELQYELLSADLHFDRSLRRPLSYVLARFAELLASRSTRIREYYEYRCAWLVPCMEIRFELRRL